MNLGMLYEEFKEKLIDIRPFLRTKIGSKLALFFIADFIALFFAPLVRGFLGTALVACVASVYLILFWRKHDREHIIVPVVLLSLPMLLDMLIYHKLAIIVCLITAIAAMFLAAYSPFVAFFDKMSDSFYSYFAAGAICVCVVIAACLLLLVVRISIWIFYIIAFLMVVAIFMGVVFSTAAYTASDGRRQARKRRMREEQEERYRSYQPRKRDTQIYNLEDEDFTDIDE